MDSDSDATTILDVSYSYICMYARRGSWNDDIEAAPHVPGQLHHDGHLDGPTNHQMTRGDAAVLAFHY